MFTVFILRVPFTLLMMSVQSAFFSPAKYGILPEILPEEKLSWGNGVLQLGTFVAIISGTAISGVLIEGIWTGVTMCRIDRKTFHRNVAERAEFEADLIEHLTEYRARAIRGVFPRAWSRTACQGCEYGPLCGRSPGAREIEEGAAYRVEPRERTYE